MSQADTGSGYAVGLIDFGPPEFSCRIRGKEMLVYGLSALSVFGLIKKYPEIQAILEQKLQNLTAERVGQIGPEVAFKIMAMGLLKRSDFSSERDWDNAVLDGMRKIGDLGIGEQTELLDTVIFATMPQGKDPFIATLNRIKARFSGSDEIMAPSTNLQESFGAANLNGVQTPGIRPRDN